MIFKHFMLIFPKKIGFEHISADSYLANIPKDVILSIICSYLVTRSLERNMTQGRV